MTKAPVKSYPVKYLTYRDITYEKSTSESFSVKNRRKVLDIFFTSAISTVIRRVPQDKLTNEVERTR
jgi:hypothetical protein